eukprot:CAMPEP_0195296590 /NCGR_PEP_ID=MMETSP0707-20130614/19776_1 /TAXON_ID=33640 /ORGANISM="Asterionellopsis glacialis, Strain CCMP134" /LENGTH=608 /DNA_ID=CAMNT_0040358147 /DNA_START=85 /DNA_END=1911 /DNA_ORIENTATION=+
MTPKPEESSSPSRMTASSPTDDPVPDEGNNSNNNVPATVVPLVVGEPASTARSDNTINVNHNNVSSDVKVDNPNPHRLAEGDNATPLEVIGVSAIDKLVIIMVGLPATGKTHIAKRICRFLSFFHDIPSQIFNVGDYRRQLCGAQQPASFYDPNNKEAATARHMACDAALTDLFEFMRRDGVRVAAFDATNSTRSRRNHILQQIRNSGTGAKTMFIESVCDSEELLEENIRKVKLNTPDYRDMESTKAIQDFKERRQQYESVYDPLDENHDGCYVKIINCKRFVVNSVRGYLPLKVVHFVMNLHTLPRTFYLTRHGQSEYNLLGKIGGDSGLTPSGIEYAKRLAEFAKECIAKDSTSNGGNAPKNKTPETSSNEEQPQEEEETTSTVEPKKPIPARLWTSTLRRTKETAQFIEHDSLHHVWDNGEEGEWVQFRPMAKRNLDELYAGVCDGMTYKEIEQMYPDEFERRQEDKLAYRYPRGESYMDVTLRLEPLAHEMERTREPILMVAHQGILRILYAYFMGLDRKEAPYVSIPLNMVIQLHPHAYGCDEKRFLLMTKEEMMNNSTQDGQDEPVTSMPVKTRRLSTKEVENQVHSQISPSDPIMNAPSC